MSNSEDNSNFEQNMSVYIPRCDTRSLPKRASHETDDAYESRVSAYIVSKFNTKYHYGDVTRVDIIAKLTPDNYTYYVAFLHINWIDSPASRVLQAEIFNPHLKAKLYYCDKWFWHLNRNTNPLSAVEAALHKRIYNLERDLLKTTCDRDTAHIMLLKKVAPNSWIALHNYVLGRKPLDYEATMRYYVHAFIPIEFHAPLRIEPRDISCVSPAPQPRYINTNSNSEDLPVLIREKPKRSVRYNPKEEFQKEYENNCALLVEQLAKLSATESQSEDNQHDKPDDDWLDFELQPMTKACTKCLGETDVLDDCPFRQRQNSLAE